MAYILTSNGEIVDKYTILLIKSEKITNVDKLENIRKELYFLEPIINTQKFQKITHLLVELKSINIYLWEMEDEIRKKEEEKSFDDEFITLARNIYLNNDRRAAIKYQINIATDSPLCEEKSHVLPY
jgi:hypothetical protein